MPGFVQTEFLPLPQFRYTDLDFDVVMESLEGIVKYHDSLPGLPQFWNDLFESNVGHVLMKGIGYASELAQFSANQIAQNVYLETTTRYDSALKLSAFLGYRPGMPQAATMAFAPFRNPIPGGESGSLQVARGEQFSFAGRTWEVAESFAYTWAPGAPFDSASAQITCVDAQSIEDDFVAYSGSVEDDDAKFQFFETSEFPVTQGSWEVTVNGAAWSEVDALIYTGATNSYQVTLVGYGGVRITFGDGKNGNVPPSGAAIVISYRIGGGSAGNLPEGSSIVTIPSLVNGTRQQVKWVSASAGADGVDRESIESIKRNAPRWHLSTNRAITRTDYDAIVQALSQEEGNVRVSRSITKLRHDDGTYLGSEQLFVDTYVWAFDTVETPWSSTGYTQVVGAMPAIGVTSLEESMNRNDIAMINVYNTVYAGTMRVINIDLGTVTIMKELGSEIEAIEDEIEEAILALFQTYNPGDTFFWSRLWRAVNSVRGISNFVIQSPTADVTLLETEMPELGTLTKTLTIEVSS